jgi:hypothetical protein
MKGGSPGIYVYVNAENIDLGVLRVRLGRLSKVSLLRKLIIKEISDTLKQKYPAAAAAGEDFKLPDHSEIHFASRELNRDKTLEDENITGGETVYMTNMRELLPAIDTARANNAPGGMEEGGARRKTRKHRMRKHRRRRNTRRH